MNKGNIKIIFLIFFSVIILKYGVISVYAAENVDKTSLGVIPAILEDVTSPGEVKETKVVIVNNTNFPLPIKGSVLGFTPMENVKDFDRFNISDWYSVNPEDFIIQPKEEKLINISIKVPENANPGGYYSTIFFQPLIPDDVVGSSSTRIVSRVGVLSLLIVKGEFEENLSLGDIKYRKFQQFGPIKLSFTLNNTGNVHLLPVGDIVIKDIFKREVAKLDMNPSIILPGSEKEYVFNLDKKYLFGRFTISYNFMYGTEQKTIFSDKESFWVIPWFTIMLLTSTIFFFIIYRRRLYRALKVLIRGKMI
jgi:hypothetical protein